MTSDLTTIRERGFNALTKELGATGTAQFIRHFDMGSGNYTEEREELLRDVTLDDIVASIKRRKEQGK